MNFRHLFSCDTIEKLFLVYVNYCIPVEFTVSQNANCIHRKTISCYQVAVAPGGGGALECNLTGRCPFFKSLHNRLGKKFAF